MEFFVMEQHHESTKQVLNRLSRAIGHLEAVRHMVEEGRDCPEVLVQLAAVRRYNVAHALRFRVMVVIRLHGLRRRKIQRQGLINAVLQSVGVLPNHTTRIFRGQFQPVVVIVLMRHQNQCSCAIK